MPDDVTASVEPIQPIPSDVSGSAPTAPGQPTSAQMVAAAGPRGNLPQPVAAAPSAAPMPQPTGAAPSGQPPAEPSVAQQDDKNYSVLGRIAHSLLGKNVEYVPGPNGQIERKVSDRKPGDFFRSLVAGALLGGMVGAGEETFGKGAAKGGGAVMQLNEARDERNYQRAERAVQSSREQQKLDMEKERMQQERLRQQAEIAHMHTQDLVADSQMDLMHLERVDKLNEYNDKFQTATVGVGGHEAVISAGGKNVNGQAGNGSALMQLFMKDPRAFDAPTGYHRVHVQKVDTNGLHYKLGVGWLDESNQPVDMASRTTHTFYDVADSVWNQHITMSGKDLNKLAGFNAFKDDEQKTIAYGDLVNLKGQGTKTALEEQKVQLEKQQILFDIAKTGREYQLAKKQIELGNQQEGRLLLEDLDKQRDSLTARWKESAQQFDPETKKDFDTQLKAIDQESREIKERYFGYKPSAPAGSTQPPPAGPQKGTPEFYRTTAGGILDKMPDRDQALAYVDGLLKQGAVSGDDAALVKQEIRNQARERGKGPGWGAIARGAAGAITQAVTGVPAAPQP